MALDQKIYEKIKANDPSFKCLDLSHQQLTMVELHEIIKALDENHHIDTLNISGNHLGELGAELLAKNVRTPFLIASNCGINDAGAISLSKNVYFRSLVLVDNEIKDDGVKALSKNQTLQSLDLTRNIIGKDGAIALAENKSLRSLVLHGCEVNNAGLLALSKNSFLQSLDLSYNKFDSTAAQSFAENIRLKELVMIGNQLGTNVMAALGKNSTLTALNISYNEVNDEGACALTQNKNLTYLDVSYNQIRFKGAQALSYHPNLKRLKISYNLIGNEGAIAIAQSRSMTHLDFIGNRVGFEGAHALSLNNILIELDLGYNNLGDAGIIMLARNHTLKNLYLCYNQIGDAGALALSDNHTLKTLVLNYNQIGEKGRQALEANKSLSSLIISKEQPPEFTEENLDTIFLLTDNFLCITSLKGIIQFFNPTFIRILNYAPDELLSHSLKEFIHPDDQKKMIEIFQTFEKHPYPEQHFMHHFECRCRDKNGSYRLIRWGAQIEHERVYAVGADITEQRRYELGRNHVIRLEEATSYGQQQTEFIARLSHEIRNPLHGITGTMEALKDKVGEMNARVSSLNNNNLPTIKDEMAKLLKSMQSSLQQMDSCVNHQANVLKDNVDLVKITEKKMELKKEVFDLRQVTQDIIQQLTSQAETKKLKLIVKSSLPPSPLVKGDAMRLKQIFINLIGNAIKFTQEGTIEVHLSLKDMTSGSILVLMDVADTGIGMSPEDVSAIFKKFSRVSDQRQMGSGLGLYISKQLANLMEGDIQVKSEKGKGSVFSVSLLLLKPSEEEKKQYNQAIITQSSFSQQTQAELISSTSPIITKPKKILVVDDNEINRKLLEKTLQKAGYECILAKDGLEAVEIYDKQQVDAILMDLVMPKMDGNTAMKKIREHEVGQRRRRTTIIAVTANVLERDQREAMEKGFDAYLTKPYKQGEILKLIEQDYSPKQPISMPSSSHSSCSASPSTNSITSSQLSS